MPIADPSAHRALCRRCTVVSTLQLFLTVHCTNCTLCPAEDSAVYDFPTPLANEEQNAWMEGFTQDLDTLGGKSRSPAHYSLLPALLSSVPL